MKKRTGSRTLTIYNVSLDEAFEIIHKAFKDKESDQDEKTIETEDGTKGKRGEDPD